MEGISNVKVTGMGDRLLLLQMREDGGLEEVMKSHEEWWNVMFKRVRRWSPQMVSTSISVWLKVHGIPLHV